MARAAGVLRWTAFAIMMFVGLAGTLFAIGEAMNDPGGRAGLLMSALWVVPTAAGGLLAATRPAAASWVLHAVLLVLLGLWVWFALDPVPWREVMELRGPILPIATFACGVPAAVLGLHHPRAAGTLLVMLGLAPALALLVAAAAVATALPYGWSLLGTAVGISAVPQVLTGVMFLLAWRLGNARLRSVAGSRSGTRPGGQLGQAGPATA